MNVILLMGEDTGRHLGCYGDPCGQTPNLDRLAAEGTRYTNAIGTAPVCAPSRSSVITCRYPWSLGTHHMRCRLIHPPRLFTQDLRDAGYYVNWYSKTDFNFEPPLSLADDRRPWLDDLRRGTLPDKPFFLYQNFGVTHESTMWLPEHVTPSDFCAGEERRAHAHLLRGRPIRPADVPVPPYLPDTPEVRDDLVRYYESLVILDHQVGQVLEALRQSPYAQNTIVIYMTDHGRGLPREKRWCYDAGVHMPLIVQGPGIERGAVCEELVNWVDIGPTVMSLAGLPTPDSYQGQAFLGQHRREPRRYAFAGRDRMDEAFDRVRAVRDERWHYIRNFYPDLPYAQRIQYMERMQTMCAMRQLHASGELIGPAAAWMAERKPVEELYDTWADPHTIHNLADQPEHAATLARMRDALTDFLAQEGDLGLLSERELIQRGLILDQLAYYRSWIRPLPREYRIGDGLTVLEMPTPAAAPIAR